MKRDHLVKAARSGRNRGCVGEVEGRGRERGGLRRLHLSSSCRPQCPSTPPLHIPRRRKLWPHRRPRPESPQQRGNAPARPVLANNQQKHISDLNRSTNQKPDLSGYLQAHGRHVPLAQGPPAAPVLMRVLVLALVLGAQPPQLRQQQQLWQPPQLRRQQQLWQPPQP